MAGHLDKEPIIIIRKKGKLHGGHHGGAWKVAYADFVTALMSLFIVLWLMNSSKSIQEAVGGYFRDPYGAAKKVGTDIGAGEKTVIKKEDLNKLKDELMKAMAKSPDFEKLKSQIEIKVTPEGLRIELMESSKGTFFELGKSIPTPALVSILTILSEETGKLPNPVSIEGHTDAKPYSDSTTYGNWELSSDRGNAARRLMEAHGLHNGQVVQVRGFADRKLRKPDQPYDASNRRISVLIQYMPSFELPEITTDKPSEAVVHGSSSGKPAVPQVGTTGGHE